MSSRLLPCCLLPAGPEGSRAHAGAAAPRSCLCAAAPHPAVVPECSPPLPSRGTERTGVVFTRSGDVFPTALCTSWSYPTRAGPGGRERRCGGWVLHCRLRQPCSSPHRRTNSAHASPCAFLTMCRRPTVSCAGPGAEEPGADAAVLTPQRPSTRAHFSRRGCVTQ